MPVPRIRRYASPTVSLVVRFVTAYAWLTSMCIVALVPIDVWSTLMNMQSAPDIVCPITAIYVIWNIAYW